MCVWVFSRTSGSFHSPKTCFVGELVPLGVNVCECVAMQQNDGVLGVKPGLSPTAARIGSCELLQVTPGLRLIS